MIRRVVQMDPTGCGIACAAMLGRTTYSRAKSLAVDLNIVSSKPPYYIDTGSLKLLLCALGLTLSKGGKLTHWHSLHCLSVVGVNYNERNSTWHWVVYVPTQDGGYVLDPRMSVTTARRTDFLKMRPRSFVSVAHLHQDQHRR